MVLDGSRVFVYESKKITYNGLQFRKIVGGYYFHQMGYRFYWYKLKLWTDFDKIFFKKLLIMGYNSEKLLGGYYLHQMGYRLLV